MKETTWIVDPHTGVLTVEGSMKAIGEIDKSGRQER